MLRFLFVIVSISLFIQSCKDSDNHSLDNSTIIEEVFQTPRDENDNIDSPAIWHGPNGENWLISTAKSTDKLFINNGADGAFIKTVCESGDSLGQLKRPNGISVIDDLVIIVERDNKRLQVFKLPSFESLGFIGKDLIKPYGLFVYKDDSKYNLYVTDNYETAEELIPPNNELNRRVHQYSFIIDENGLNSEFVKVFGDTTKKGALRIVESVYGDVENNVLLFSEEDESNSSVKVYDLEGNFKEVFGSGLFNFQVEGISLYKEKDGNGFWVITDQSMTNNRFLLFDRKTFNFIGAFKGTNTLNTDGIWLTQKPFSNFKDGAFFAVHNDGNVSGFDLSEIIKISKKR